jgi:hypothetical protein
MIKKYFPPWLTLRVPIETRRRRLLNDPLVIELIKSARISQSMGENLETWLRAMKK